MPLLPQSWTGILRSAPYLLAGSLTGSVVLYAATAPPVAKQAADTPQWVPLKSTVKAVAKASPASTPPAHLPIKSTPVKTPAPTAKPLAGSAALPSFERDVAPLVQRYCVGCHSAPDAPAGIALDKYHNAAAVLKDKDSWDRVARNVESGHMPPPGKPSPSLAQRERLAQWVDTAISNAQCKLPDPGHVTLRRLNREEYNNTIRDLVGVDFRPGDDFPSDDVGYGFDNIGDVLSVSPLLTEKYLSAAEKIAEKAIITPESQGKPFRMEAEKLDQLSTAAGSVTNADPGRVLTVTDSAIGTDYAFPQAGDYLLRVQAYGQQYGPDPARMSLRLDGKELHLFDVKALDDAPGWYEEKITTAPGKHRIAMVYTNNYKDAKGDRNLVVQSLEIKGPLKAENLPLSHRRILFVQPTDSTRDICAHTILAEFARRAYRRPVTDDEVNRLTRYVTMATKNGESFERGIQLAVEAALVSPNFLFRVESDSDAKNPKAHRPLNDYELATRLSYFLWSSMPDDQLFFEAKQDDLHKPDVLEEQVRRMLNNPRSQALADNFGMQWLTLRNLSNVSPDPTLFPDFNDALRAAMLTETQSFFQYVVQDDRSVLDFIDSNYAFLNDALAKHYGIPGVEGKYFRKVELKGKAAEQRGGLLSQGSILTVTSNPTRTSPVKRGKWVLEEIFNAPPPPPPPGVPALVEAAALTGTTVRQRLEEHRKNPACASCHARMDPIGFGLENYDATGGWRTVDLKAPLDASGTLTDGRSFCGPAQLKALLKAQKKQFVHALSEKLLTFALGRGVEPYDKCAVDTIVDYAAKHDYHFSAIVLAIVRSEPFQKRRGDGGQA